MIRFFAGLLPAWAWFAAAAAVLGLTLSYGHRLGARGVQARWDAAELQRERTTADQRREDGRISRAAAANFEAWRANQARRQADLARRLSNALQRPVSCPASGLLADVPVPADVVDGLRDAGADNDPAGAAPTVSGPAMQPRAGLPDW